MPGGDAQVMRQLAEDVLPLFAWSDGIASRLADAYRSGMTVNFVLATLAVAYTLWATQELILPVLLVSGPVLLRGNPGHWQIGLLLAAFAALIGGLFIGSEVAEQSLTVTGAALLLTAHWARLRRVHRH